MSRVLANEELLKSLSWRYATKRFDPARPIPADDWETLEEALVLSPSSYGLQPWRFFVITNQPLKESLVPHAYRQRQVADCSHLLVIAVIKRLTADHIDHYLDSSIAIRGGDRAALDGFRKMMIADVVDGPRGHAGAQWAKLQSYIALGNFMTSAALLGIDTCPMEGFVPERFDEALDLDAQGLTTSVLCAAGYRDDSDKYRELAKVRFAKQQLFHWIR